MNHSGMLSSGGGANRGEVLRRELVKERGIMLAENLQVSKA